MQEFTTRGNRHDFAVDGKSYWLPGATVKDYEQVGSFAELSDDDKIPAFRAFVRDHARPRGIVAVLTGRAAPRAVERLNVPQLSSLFTAWMAPGVPVGESSSSPVE